MPFKGGLTPGKFPMEDLQRSRIMELAPDMWMIEGFCTSEFFIKPPNCNIFILNDHALVLLIDTGLYPYYRKIVLDILEKYKKKGAKQLILMNTHGHFDHVANNDLILEAGYEDTRFLLPEIELETIDLLNHFMGDFAELEEYYNPFSTLTPPSKNLPSLASMPKEKAKVFVKNYFQTLYRGINTMADKAIILPMKSRMKKIIGGVEFEGWQIGRFFAIHDGSQSPGHLSFYDPNYKVLLSGDLTLEINPPFMNSSLDKCIEMTGKFHHITEQGIVELATDSHRSAPGFSGWVKNLGFQPLHKIQLEDMARGKQNCLSFYLTFNKYFTGLKQEILDILHNLGEATVTEIVSEFKKSKSPVALSKKNLIYPNLPSRLEVLAAVVLKESKALKRKEGEKIIFTSSN